MLSFDEFSIKRKYKEKTVRIIKISLFMYRMIRGTSLLVMVPSPFTSALFSSGVKEPP